MCHPLLNFFYFAVALLFTMFNQHPVFLGISYAGAFVYGGLLNGWRKTLKQGLLLTLPGLLIIALLNPMFNHYGVTMLYYIESSGNWITLEALVYGLVLGAVMFIVIQWFSCYNTVMTSDKFIYLFGNNTGTFTGIVYGTSICPAFSASAESDTKWSKGDGT